MEDNKIIELFFHRDENAIVEINKKYGKYCNVIANNILQNHEDSKECVNDAYLKVWNSIPPQNPNVLKLFLAKITRNLAIHKYEKNFNKKRNIRMQLALEELEECLPEQINFEDEMEYKEIVNNLNYFISNLSDEKRKIFLSRYWYLHSIKAISDERHISEGNVKVILHRLRNELKVYLLKKGVSI